MTVELSGVGKTFGGSAELALFSDVSFTLKQGESIAVLGPSGSGKSTLLKIIAGLEKQTVGKVTVGTKSVSMLFQKNALFDSLTVLENLLYPLKEALGEVGSKARKKSVDLLESVGLSEMQKLFPNELSGGMQKRLGIARALVVSPELFLCDEPTAGLDPITSRKIADLLVDSRKQNGFTLIAITNEPKRALQIGDRVAVFIDGRLNFSDSAQTHSKVERFLRGEA